MRHVPPVAFPMSASAVWHAARQATTRDTDEQRALAALQTAFERDVLALTDSGTSALTLALRVALADHPGLVAVPAYGCIDVPTAVMGAGARAIAYDVNAERLAPELSSVEAALRRGARVVVAGHLFGHVADLAAVRVACDRASAVLIEDAAQWAGASLGGAPLGRTGHLALLSLGRGKGLVGTGGGVLTGDASWRPRVSVWRESIARGPASASRTDWRRLAIAFAAIGLGSPSLYAVPASVPALHLGEMRFHPPTPIDDMASLSLRLLPDSLQEIGVARDERARRATRLQRAVTSPKGVWPELPATAASGYLRLPFLMRDDAVARWNPRAAAQLGIVRPYPRGLREQHEVLDVVEPIRDPLPGADRLCAQLVTLPLHAHVSAVDETRLIGWLSA